MLDKDHIYRLFCAFAGLGEAGEPRARPLCDAAAGALEARLKVSVDRTRHMERLCIAAAALAYCDFCELAAASEGAQEIRVGDISLRSPAASSAAAKDLSSLRGHFLADIADLLEAPFVLGTVKA